MTLFPLRWIREPHRVSGKEANDLLLACPPDRQPAVRGALEALGGQFADFAFRAHGVEAREGARVWRPS